MKGSILSKNKKLFYLIKLNGICLFILILVFSSCSPIDNTDEEDCLKFVEGYIQPIAEGNFWVREQLAYSGSQIEPGLTDTGRIVIEKMVSISLNDTVYLAGLQRLIYPGDISKEVANLYWNGSAGLYYLGMMAPNDTLFLKPGIRYKYPVDVGESWSVQSYSYDPYENKIYIADTLIYTCVAQDEPFITPLDTFNTIVYHFYYKPVEDVLSYWHAFQYFSPGIGPVGTEIYSSFDTTYSYESKNLRELKFRLQMIDYCLH